MHPTLRTLCAIAALLPAVAAAQFKWIDANGRVNYGDVPPPDARRIEPINRTFGDADPVASLPIELRRAVVNFPVTLYSASDCGAPCNSGRDLLRTRGTPFTEITLNTPQDIEAFSKLGLGDRVPVLMVGRQSVQQFQSDRWNDVLDGAGYPRNAMLPRTWTNPPPRPLAPAPSTPTTPALPATPPDGGTPLPNAGPAAR